MAKPRSFLDLPLELRQPIYNHLFHRASAESNLLGAITPATVDCQGNKVHPHTKLMRSCHQVHLEMTGLFYRDTVFRFSDKTMQEIMHWLAAVGSRNLASIRHFHFDFSGPDPNDETLDPKPDVCPSKRAILQDPFAQGNCCLCPTNAQPLSKTELLPMGRDCGVRNLNITFQSFENVLQICSPTWPPAGHRDYVWIEKVCRGQFVDEVRDLLLNLFLPNSDFMQVLVSFEHLQDLAISDDRGKSIENYVALERHKNWYRKEWQVIRTGIKRVKDRVARARARRAE